MESNQPFNPMAKIILPLLFLAACQQSAKDQHTENISDTTTPQEISSEDENLDSYSEPLFGNSNLPNIMEDMDTKACLPVSENYPDTPGATSYFAGAYIKDGNSWMGREKWLLFPNQAWQEVAYQQWQEGNQEVSNIAQGYPCEVSWDVLVTEHDEMEQCLACSLAFFVDASVNANITTCPQSLWNEVGTRDWQSNYEIASFSGNSIFYFRSSGQAFGWGYASENELNFLSEPSCKWF